MRTPRWLAIAFLVLIVGTAGAQGQGFEFPFFPGKAPKSDSRFVRMEEGPCGKIAVAKVAILPPTRGRGAFFSELLVEVDAAERTVRRWRLPIDAYPIAFRKELLIFLYDRLPYAVDLGGRVVLYVGAKPPDSPLPENCKKAKEFEGSAYQVCQALLDMSTGKSRKIRFQYPCT